jgi:HEPN domain-containing protein
MPPDEVKLTECRAWLSKAPEDLRAAVWSMKASPPLADHARYSCQQCAEKALKAFLTWHDTPFKKTHDIQAIGLVCATLDPTLAVVIEPATELTIYAARYRYPGLEDEPPELQPDEASRIAEAVLNAVTTRLGIRGSE